jgi:YHS domain-containing protein/thiol-disulfide isomerase/thioredoxin
LDLSFWISDFNRLRLGRCVGHRQAIEKRHWIPLSRIWKPKSEPAPNIFAKLPDSHIRQYPSKRDFSCDRQGSAPDKGKAVSTCATTKFDEGMPAMLAKNTILSLVLVTGLSSIGFAQSAVRWAPNLPAAQQMAAQQGRLVLIHFHGPNCLACAKVEQNVLSRPEVAQAIQAEFVPVKVDVAEFPAIRQQYGVTSWPSDVVVKPSGEMQYRTISAQDPHRYVSVLQRVADWVRENSSPRVASNGGVGGYDRAPATATNPNGRYSAGETPSQDQYDRRPPVAPPATGGPSAGYDPRDTGYGQPTAPRYDSSARYERRPANDYSTVPPATGGPRYTDPLGSRQPSQPVATGQPYASRPPVDPWAAQGSAADTRGTNAPLYDPHAGRAPSYDPGAARGYAPPSRQDDYRTASLAPPYRPGPPAAAMNKKPPLCMEGYCPVTLMGSNAQWKKGDARFGAIHRGKTYLFAGEEEQRAFLANPDAYSPILSGNDPIAFVEQGQVVPGKRTHGIFYGKQVYLFASEQNLQKFWQSPQRYATIVFDTMQRAGR